MDFYWIRNTDNTLADLRRTVDNVAVLPLASIESHGPHLTLGSDVHCIDHIMRRVVEQEPVAVLPTLPYSSVSEARMLPGAVHVRSELLMDLVETICDEVVRNGFRKIVLLHGHGGNIFLGQAFTKRVLEREKPYAVYSIPVFAGRAADVNAVLETPEHGHACEMETSMNMVACPDLVDLDVLGTRTFPTQPGPDVGPVTTPVDWVARHPDMAVGEPQKASPEKGEKIIAAWVTGIVETLRKIKQDTICESVLRRYADQAACVGAARA